MLSDRRNDNDVEALRSAVGDLLFLRGKACVDERRVMLLFVGSNRVVGRVGGTLEHRVELAWRGSEPVRKCGCASVARLGVCEHMVALALATARRQQARAPEIAGYVVSVLTSQMPQGTSTVVEEKADGGHRPVLPPLAQGDDAAVEMQLRSVIEGTTGLERALNRPDVEAWVSNNLAVFDVLRRMARTRRAHIAL